MARYTSSRVTPRCCFQYMSSDLPNRQLRRRCRQRLALLDNVDDEQLRAAGTGARGMRRAGRDVSAIARLEHFRRLTFDIERQPAFENIIRFRTWMGVAGHVTVRRDLYNGHDGFAFAGRHIEFL